MKLTPILFAFIALVVFIVASGSIYSVGEQQQVIITEFGKPVGKPINANEKSEAGLHFKTPFIQEVNTFEKRTLQWDSTDPSRNRLQTASEMPTRDKLYIVVETFARWRIADPLLYFQSLRDERSALSRLDDIIGSETRNIIAGHDLIEVIRTDKTRKPQVDETIMQISPNAAILPSIQFGREKLEAQILAAASEKVKLWGIEVLSVRFKRVNYKADVLTKIYERMISERTQVAERFRSEGMGEAAKINGTREQKLREIESGAYKKVQEIQGNADAAAIEIYAKAYNTSPAAGEFYQFLKTMETYKATMGRDTTLILTTDSDFFKFFKRIDGGKAPNKTQP